MNRHAIAVLFSCFVLLTGSAATAQTVGQRLVARFDTDGDGVLSAEERQAARESFTRRGLNEDGRQPKTLQWKVGDLQREARVYLPAEDSDTPAPVVFGFHGHGGSSANAARSFGFHKHWPEALVVYMQGVPTPGQLTDPEGKRNGWQHAQGAQDDRDLKFFDAVLATLRKDYKIDDSRIYVSGHSNGGGFTYLLWACRHDVFAAVAPCAAASRVVVTLKPKPAMHIAGKRDQLVKFWWQARAIVEVQRVNGCAEEGEAWAKDCTLYTSEHGAPFVAFIHNGTHAYPTEAPPLIVRFFKEHPKKPSGNIE